jgi:glycerol uptake facilitator-like aquaporin
MVESKTERGRENKTKDTAEPEEIIPIRKHLLAELFPSFVLELVLTFFLMFLGISLKEKIGYKPFGGIAIGSFIAAAGIIGAPVSRGVR